MRESGSESENVRKCVGVRTIRKSTWFWQRYCPDLSWCYSGFWKGIEDSDLGRYGVIMGSGKREGREQYYDDDVLLLHFTYTCILGKTRLERFVNGLVCLFSRTGLGEKR